MENSKDREIARRAYYKDSAYFQDKSNAEILSMIRGGDLVKISSVQKVLEKLSAREDFRYSDKDYNIFIKPLMAELERAIRNQDIPCYASPDDPLPEGGYMLKSHLAAFIAGQPLPDGGEKFSAIRHEFVQRCVDGHFDKGMMGEIQRYMDTHLPMRTPSVILVGDYEKTGKELNLRTPFLLAVGYAPAENGMEQHLPSVGESLSKREDVEKGRRERVVQMHYRGAIYYMKDGEKITKPPPPSKPSLPENDNGP